MPTFLGVQLLFFIIFGLTYLVPLYKFIEYNEFWTLIWYARLLCRITVWESSCDTSLWTSRLGLRLLTFVTRLESRFLNLEPWFWDWNPDYQIFSLNIETEIVTLRTIVLVLRLVSWQKKIGRDPCYWNSHKSHWLSLV